MLIDNVDPLKWYRVREVSEILGWSVDTVRRWIYMGKLQAFIRPGQANRRKRVFRSARIKGSELIRFTGDNLTPRT